MTRKEIAAALETMRMGVQRWGSTWLPPQGNGGRGPVTLLLCLIFLAILLRTAWLSDDARITLRTVLNVTHGYGLTFNVAERVQTYTHPLWMLMLTGGVPGGWQRLLRGDRPVGGCLPVRFLVDTAPDGHQRAGLDRCRGAAAFSRVRGFFDVGSREPAVEPAARRLRRPRDPFGRGTRNVPPSLDRAVDGCLVLVPHASRQRAARGAGAGLADRAGRKLEGGCPSYADRAAASRRLDGVLADLLRLSVSQHGLCQARDRYRSG